jgi:hypothetical protein
MARPQSTRLRRAVAKVPAHHLEPFAGFVRASRGLGEVELVHHRVELGVPHRQLRGVEGWRRGAVADHDLERDFVASAGGILHHRDQPVAARALGRLEAQPTPKTKARCAERGRQQGRSIAQVVIVRVIGGHPQEGGLSRAQVGAVERGAEDARSAVGGEATLRRRSRRGRGRRGRSRWARIDPGSGALARCRGGHRRRAADSEQPHADPDDQGQRERQAAALRRHGWTPAP